MVVAAIPVSVVAACSIHSCLVVASREKLAHANLLVLAVPYNPKYYSANASQ
jgi:hypothetical protein